MVYLEDKDLEFIKKLSSKDLHFLVKILDEPNTSFLSKDKKFKENFPLHNKYFEPIGEELQHFGGNTIANIARLNKGVGYKEILLDVNKKITNKECDKSEKIEDIEMGILKHLFDCLDNNALYELISNINDKYINKNSIKEILDNKNDKNYLKVLDKLVKFLITNISILNYSASTLKDNSKTLVFDLINIPASVVATSLKTISDPAFRVTIPAVLEIARLRANYLFGGKNEIEKYEISVVGDKNEILNNLDKFSVVEIKENLDDDIGFGDTLAKTGIETSKNVDLLNKANELLKTNVPIEKLSLDKSGKMLGQVRDEITKKIKELPRFERARADIIKAISSYVLINMASIALGQEFMLKIDNKLKKIDQKLADIKDTIIDEK